MSQLRRSARVAARTQQARSQQSSQPMTIDLTDTEHNSDGLSDDPVALSDVDLLPVPSCFVCNGHCAVSGPFSRCTLQCCDLAGHLQCIAGLVHHPSQSVIWPTCNAQSLSSVDVLHFQLLCGIHHVEVPAGECMICSAPQSIASSVCVSCCRQRMYYERLARSVLSCGFRCPFCTQDLVPFLSDPLVAASFEHLNIPTDFNAPAANSALNSLSVPDNMPLPPPIFPLCCADICGHPDFEPLNGVVSNSPICPRFFL